jgi:uncharacterized protein (TIGR02594 family)
MVEPAWLIIATSHIGLKEIPGPRHNAVITGWLSKLGAWWSDDETPWCGTFVAHCMQATGQPYPKNWFRAKAWVDYGSPLRPERIAPGALLIFDRRDAKGRSIGGHIGFYDGEDAKHYRVLGANQANSVNIMRIPKARCIAIRWPKGVPVIGGPVILADGYGTISTNEA